jgi:RNA polymerase sigma factor (sigma-70 family)
MERSERTTATGPADFRSTHWSVVLAANQPDSPESRKALARLCETYWYPVYIFIRRRGHDPDDAKDLTQELFARLIEKQFLEAVDQEKGRFRSFLLTCVKRLLNKEWKKAQTLKRGGEYTFVPLDDAVAEARYGAEPADGMSPEKLFERRWALTLLEQTLEQLKAEHARAGKTVQFDALEVFLSGSKEPANSYGEIGAQIGMTEGAARQAAFRMRGRFGELLRARLSAEVASPAELEAEMMHLRAVLSG